MSDSSCTCFTPEKPLDADCPLHGAKAMAAWFRSERRKAEALRALSEALRALSPGEVAGRPFICVAQVE